MKDAVHRGFERELAQSIGTINGATADRVCADVVKSTLNSSKLTEVQKDMLAAAACNGVWTKTSAAAAGV